MNPKEFSEKVSNWGSAMHAGDPGACLYGFDGRGLVQSEDHRRDCIRQLEGDGRKAADANIAAGDDPDEQHPEIDALVAYLKTAPVVGWVGDLDTFTEAYVKAALWSTNDESNESGGEPLDENYAIEHIDPEALAAMKADCARFQEIYGPLLTDENYTGRGDSGVESQAGYDFWMTRCGHGAGFWDGDWEEPAATVLTAASKSFGECDLYLGDDGRIHVSGGRPDPEPVEGAPEPDASPKPF